MRKPMRQWMLRITAYAEKLLADLDTIDWSDSLKEMQRNWIGRSEGAEVDFQIADCQLPVADAKIRVFTTRPDTLFGATYMVLAPEHRLVDEITTEEQDRRWRIIGHIPRAKATWNAPNWPRKSPACSPAPTPSIRSTARKSPFGLPIMCWPATARAPSWPCRPTTRATLNLPRSSICRSSKSSSPRTPKPTGRVSPMMDWRSIPGSSPACPRPKPKRKSPPGSTKKASGKKTINYKLRDWLFSRQRYWGEPFPIIWKRTPPGICYHEALPESALPLLPPTLEDYKPTPAASRPWRAPRTGCTARRLARAKPTPCPNGPDLAGIICAISTRKTSKHSSAKTRRIIGWGRRPQRDVRSPAVRSPATTPGVDLYVGGTEHAVLHLLYARFWHKVLFDLGHVSTPEPFFKLVNQGLILGEDGQKMSKSRGNVVNPDDILKEFGADAFRLYEMFMGPLQDAEAVEHAGRGRRVQISRPRLAPVCGRKIRNRV